VFGRVGALVATCGRAGAALVGFTIDEGRGVKANGTAFVVNRGEPTILENEPIEIGLPPFM